MYKRLVFGLLLFVGLVGTAVPARAGTQDFAVSSLIADYYVSRQQDGVSEMRVHERIVTAFPDFDQNHGILRAVPQSYEAEVVGNFANVKADFVVKSAGGCPSARAGVIRNCRCEPIGRQSFFA